MAAAGILPGWLRVIVKSVHEAGTVMELTLNCIASLPSITVAQSLTTAALLSAAGAAGAEFSVAAGVVSLAGAASAGIAGAIGVAGAAGAVGVAGACGGGFSPPADSRSAQAAVSRASFMFMGSLLWGNRNMVGADGVALREGRWPTPSLRAGRRQAQQLGGYTVSRFYCQEASQHEHGFFLSHRHTGESLGA